MGQSNGAVAAFTLPVDAVWRPSSSSRGAAPSAQGAAAGAAPALPLTAAAAAAAWRPPPPQARGRAAPALPPTTSEFELGSWCIAGIGALALVARAVSSRARPPGGLRRRGREARGAAGLPELRAQSRGGSGGSLSVSERPGEGELATAGGEGSFDLSRAFNENVNTSISKVGRHHEAPITKWNHEKWDFFDVAAISVQAGKGGRGCKSFRRAPREDMAGPDGGDGGDGGSIYLVATEGVTTLNHFTGDGVHHTSEDGQAGGGTRGRIDRGRRGKHTFIPVPPGVCVYVRDAYVEGRAPGKRAGEKELVYYEETGRNFVGELTRAGEVLRIARGGRGGRGNESFFSEKMKDPWLQEVGEKGMGRWVDIEHKIVSDVGIIGMPNAGKSSLLCAVTDRRALVSALPFSTTQPNVGFHKADIHGGFSLIDIPGIIEGAHKNKGMGIRFLRHIERCRALIHLIDGNSEDPVGDYTVIRNEIAQYSTEVFMKPEVIVVNKADITEARESMPDILAALRKRCGHSRVFDVSVATGYNLEELMQRIHRWYKSIIANDAPLDGISKEEELLVCDNRIVNFMGGKMPLAKTQEKIQLDPMKKKGERRELVLPRVEWDVLEDAWRLLHPEVEWAAKRMTFDFPDHMERLNRIIKATGSTEKLSQVGIIDGQYIVVDKLRFSYWGGMIGNDARMLVTEIELDEEPEQLKKIRRKDRAKITDFI